MRRDSPITAQDLCAVFHNSLTLLSAEIEGRYFGGGVLELVPSEIRSVLIPPAASFGEHLPRLDRLSRQSEGDELVNATDGELLSRAAFDVDAWRSYSRRGGSCLSGVSRGHRGHPRKSG